MKSLEKTLVFVVFVELPSKSVRSDRIIDCCVFVLTLSYPVTHYCVITRPEEQKCDSFLHIC